MFDVKNLRVIVEGKTIIDDLDLSLGKGQIHAIMGPNGAGKSTLAKVLAGHPSYIVESGEAILEGKNLLELEPEERALHGLFMSFQYPPEIEGVSNFQFMFAAYNALRSSHGKERLSVEEFSKILDEKMAFMGIQAEFKDRSVNEGFSGGEKKRNEILQMFLLNPKLSILDETDSGLDIDALKIVARGINQFSSDQNTLLLITHYQRLLDYVKPDVVHVMIDGKIVKSGDANLALELENKGYDWLMAEVRG
jgi:Fe-S cluster assembly ATP-binding protein